MLLIAGMALAPLAAAAQPYHRDFHHGRPPPHYGGHDGNAGAVIGGALLGLGVGAVLGGALAAGPPVYTPPPVYYAPPAPAYAPPPPVYYGY